MPFQFDRWETIGGRPTARLFDPETGQATVTQDPLMAMRLGAPGLGPPPTPPNVPEVPAIPDLRTAELDQGQMSEMLDAPPGSLEDQITQRMNEVAAQNEAQKTEEVRRSNTPRTAEDPQVRGLIEGVNTGTVGAPAPGGVPLDPRAAASMTVQGRSAQVLDALGPIEMTVATPGRPGRPAEIRPDKFKRKGDPEVVDALQESTLNAYDRLAQAKESEASEEGVFLSRELASRNRQIVEGQKREEELQRSVGEAQAEKDRQLTILTEQRKRAADETVNPNQFWEDASTGKKIGLAIAMALGAFGSAITKTPNYAAELVNDYIQRDTERQYNKLAGEKEKIQADVDKFQDWLQDKGPAVQRKALEIVKRENAEAIIGRMATMKAYRSIQSRLEETQAILQLQRTKDIAELEKMLGEEVDLKFIPEQQAIAAGRRPKTRQELAAEVTAEGVIAQAAGEGLGPEEVPPGAKTLDDKVLGLGKAVSGGEGVSLGTVEAAYAQTDAMFQEMIDKYGRDNIPGIGRASALTPRFVSSDDAVRMKTQMLRVIDLGLRSKTGASAKDTEEIKEELLAIGKIDDPLEGYERAFKLYTDARRGHSRTLNTVAAGYGGRETLEEWQRRIRETPIEGGPFDPNRDERWQNSVKQANPGAR